MKELKVDAIKDGTVIDHIPAGKAIKLIGILKVDETDQLMIGTQLQSKKYGRKDVIKIENREFSDHELNIITIIAPTATFVTIRNYETVKKTGAQVPEIIEGIIKCPNPTCITNNEQMKTRFTLENAKPIQIRCSFCERIYSIDDINRYINGNKEFKLNE